jgi:hypothetical protein
LLRLLLLLLLLLVMVMMVMMMVLSCLRVQHPITLGVWRDMDAGASGASPDSAVSPQPYLRTTELRIIYLICLPTNTASPIPELQLLKDCGCLMRTSFLPASLLLRSRCSRQPCAKIKLGFTGGLWTSIESSVTVASLAGRQLCLYMDLSNRFAAISAAVFPGTSLCPGTQRNRTCAPWSVNTLAATAIRSVNRRLRPRPSG